MSEAKEVNLLLKTKDTSFFNKELKTKLTYIAISCSLLVVGLALSLFIIGRIYQKELTDLGQKTKSIEQEIQAAKNKEIQYRATNDKLVVAEKLIGQPSSVASFFEEFTNLLPPDTQIDSLSLTDTNFTANIVTRSLFSMELFLQDLSDLKKGGKFFTNIVAAAVSQDQVGFYSANIEAKVRPMKAN